MARMTPQEQRAAALEKGNAIRARHADFRRWLSSHSLEEGKQTVVEILRNNYPVQPDMKARYLIESIHRFGPSKMGQLIRKIGLAQGRLDYPLGDLTERERNVIADHLENPDLPATTTEFTPDELQLIRVVMAQVADKTSFGKQRNQLWTIAEKAGMVQ